MNRSDTASEDNEPVFEWDLSISISGGYQEEEVRLTHASNGVEGMFAALNIRSADRCRSHFSRKNCSGSQSYGYSYVSPRCLVVLSTLLAVNSNKRI